MQKKTRIILVIGILVAIIVIILLQLQTGFISKAVANRMIENRLEEYYETYGLTEEEWEILEAEGITKQDADELQPYANRFGAVEDELRSILYAIKEREREKQRQEAEETRESLKQIYANEAKKMAIVHQYVEDSLGEWIDPVLVDELNLDYTVEADEHYVGNINVMLDMKKKSRKGRKFKKIITEHFGDGDPDAEYTILFWSNDEKVMARVNIPPDIIERHYIELEDSALDRHTDFLHEKIPTLMQPLVVQEAVDYSTEIISDSSLGNQHVAIHVTIDGPFSYGSMNIITLLPESTNQANIKVVFQTTEGKEIATRYY